MLSQEEKGEGGGLVEKEGCIGSVAVLVGLKLREKGVSCGKRCGEEKLRPGAGRE